MENFGIDEPIEGTISAALNDVAKTVEEIKLIILCEKLSILWQIIDSLDAVRCLFREMFRK